MKFSDKNNDVGGFQLGW